jgi:hypothetical protein
MSAHAPSQLYMVEHSTCGRLSLKRLSSLCDLYISGAWCLPSPSNPTTHTSMVQCQEACLEILLQPLPLLFHLPSQDELAESRAECQALKAQSEAAEQEHSRLRQAGLEALTAVGSELEGMRGEVAQVSPVGCHCNS